MWLCVVWNKWRGGDISFMEKKVVLFHITCQQKPCTFSRRNWQLGLVGQIGVHKPKTKEKKMSCSPHYKFASNFSSYFHHRPTFFHSFHRVFGVFSCCCCCCGGCFCCCWIIIFFGQSHAQKITKIRKEKNWVLGFVHFFWIAEPIFGFLFFIFFIL